MTGTICRQDTNCHSTHESAVGSVAGLVCAPPDDLCAEEAIRSAQQRHNDCPGVVELLLVLVTGGGEQCQPTSRPKRGRQVHFVNH